MSGPIADFLVNTAKYGPNCGINGIADLPF